VFHGRSEKEVMLASEELRRMRQCHSQQLSITATKLANFLESVEAQETLLLQRLTDAESRRLRAPGSGKQLDRPAINANAAVIKANGVTVDITNTRANLYGEM
jgi:hypothetical protein